jgi:hypothetical protein
MYGIETPGMSWDLESWSHFAGAEIKKSGRSDSFGILMAGKISLLSSRREVCTVIV